MKRRVDCPWKLEVTEKPPSSPQQPVIFEPLKGGAEPPTTHLDIIHDMPSELFISTEELDALRGDPAVRVVDVRWDLSDPDAGRCAWERERIPGAAYLHWLDDLSDPDDSVPGQLAGPELFAAAMNRAGIDDDDLVVGYDDNVIFMAARLAWCLRTYGHDRVRVLDGGFPKWTAERRQLERGQVDDSERIRPVSFRPRLDMTHYASKQDVLALLAAGDSTLVDCRMDETWFAAGAHIPGARRLPAPSLVDAVSGTLLEAERIAASATAAGLSPDEEIVLYCGGGVSASLALAALEQAGYRSLRVYDGSWSEWSADAELPVQRH